MNTLLVVAAALINDKDEVLLAERPSHKVFPGHFEFPGGKVEPGESPEAALVRELHEELGIAVAPGDLEAFWFLSHAYPDQGFHLMMPVWVCRRWKGVPQALEHASIAWKTPVAMRGLPMIEADDPLVARLEKYLA